MIARDMDWAHIRGRPSRSQRLRSARTRRREDPPPSFAADVFMRFTAPSARQPQRCPSTTGPGSARRCRGPRHRAGARHALLRWYEPRRRAPARGARRATRIGCIVSEVMLQQTRGVARRSRVPGVPSAVPGRRRARRSSAGRGRPSVGRSGIQPAGAPGSRRPLDGSSVSATASFLADPVSLRPLPCEVHTAAAVASIAFGVPSRRSTERPAIVAGVDGAATPRLPAPPSSRPRGSTDAVRRMEPGADGPGTRGGRPRPRCGACPLRRTCRAVALDAAAAPRPSGQGRFEGSMRQVRGVIQVRSESARRPRSTSSRGSRDSSRARRRGRAPDDGRGPPRVPLRARGWRAEPPPDPTGTPSCRRASSARSRRRRARC